MTKVSKNAKLIFSLALIALAFFCSFNVTYSYFTASAKESGILNFSDVDVRFIYYDANGVVSPAGDYTQDGLYTINLYPVGGAISRGAKFELSDSINGQAIRRLTIKSMPNTTSSYVRFWIDAYVVTNKTTQEVDTSINYGKYFFLQPSDEYIESFNAYVIRGGSNAEATEGEWCYYLTVLTGGGAVDLVNSLIFQDIKNEDDEVISAIPNEILGEQLKITMTVEAVQSAHEAFKTEFDDEKGYYNNSQLWK